MSVKDIPPRSRAISTPSRGGSRAGKRSLSSLAPTLFARRCSMSAPVIASMTGCAGVTASRRSTSKRFYGARSLRVSDYASMPAYSRCCVGLSAPSGYAGPVKAASGRRCAARLPKTAMPARGSIDPFSRRLLCADLFAPSVPRICRRTSSPFQGSLLRSRTAPLSALLASMA